MNRKHSSQSSFLIWHRVWREELRPYWPKLCLIIILVLGVAGTTSLYPLAIQWIFERFEQKDIYALQIAPIIIVFVTLLKSIFYFTQSKTTNKFVIAALKRLQWRLFSTLMMREQFIFSHISLSSFAAHFTTDLTYIRDALLKLMTGLLRDSFTVLALVGALFYIDWQLAFVAMCILPFAIFPVRLIGNKLKKIAASAQLEISKMMSFVTESLYGLKTIKAYNFETEITQQAAIKFDEIEALQLKAINRRALLEPILEILGGFAVAGVVSLVAWRLSVASEINTQSALGTFTGFVTALLLAAQSVRGLGNLHIYVQEGAAALERIYTVIDTQNNVQDALNAEILVLKNAPSITFENVSFQYDHGTIALHNVNFKIEAGKTAALVGRSGSGKSTVFSLILRLADCNSGQILLNNTSIQQVTKHSLRNAIAYVGQDAVLLDGTIEDNIRFGMHDVNFEDVEIAAKRAAAHDFIMALPMGYQTYVHNRGAQLSGGERQRLSIARAFLKDAPILLLDEPTSALDAASEHSIQKALTLLCEGKTTLIVAHRLSTIKTSDIIFVLDNGEIIQKGTHQELLNIIGTYQDFFTKQTGQYTQ